MRLAKSGARPSYVSSIVVTRVVLVYTHLQVLLKAVNLRIRQLEATVSTQQVSLDAVTEKSAQQESIIEKQEDKIATQEVIIQGLETSHKEVVLQSAEQGKVRRSVHLLTLQLTWPWRPSRNSQSRSRRLRSNSPTCSNPWSLKNSPRKPSPKKPLSPPLPSSRPSPPPHRRPPLHLSWHRTPNFREQS